MSWRLRCLEAGAIDRASDGVVSFKGVPFAEAPGQIPFPGDAAPLGVKPGEDCLYLNMWAPQKPAAAKLPVMVWIHGGGFVNGGSSPPVYDGSAFAKSDVVLVSMNYRIARFGFFAHPALSAEQGAKPTANFGLLDQIAALEWVKRNVAAFGGDPSNVTVFGESAGGMSVNALLTTPLASGLLHKAIIQSGGGRKMGGGPGSAESTGVDYARQIGIEGEGADALAKLRALSADELAKGLNMASMGNASYVGGPVKGGLKADRARALLNPGNSTNVGEVGFRVGGDQMMAEPARKIARTLSAGGRPTEPAVLM